MFRLAAAIFGFGLMLEGPTLGLPTGSVGPDALTIGISSPTALRSVCLLDLPHHLGCGRGAICYFGYRMSGLFVSVPPSILARFGLAPTPLLKSFIYLDYIVFYEEIKRYFNLYKIINLMNLNDFNRL